MGKHFAKLKLFSTDSPPTENQFVLDITHTPIASYVLELDLTDAPENIVELMEWLFTNIPSYRFVRRTNYNMWFDTKKMSIISNDDGYYPDGQKKFKTLFKYTQYLLTFERLEDQVWFLMVWKTRFNFQ